MARSARSIALAALIVLSLAAGCASVRAPLLLARATQPWKAEIGEASWYGDDFQGARTASGERFDHAELTAAHPSHAFGTRLRVTNLGNGKSVVVRVNDRGPHARGRVIDLSRAAAGKLGFQRDGTATVKVEKVR